MSDAKESTVILSTHRLPFTVRKTYTADSLDRWKPGVPMANLSTLPPATHAVSFAALIPPTANSVRRLTVSMALAEAGTLADRQAQGCACEGITQSGLTVGDEAMLTGRVLVYSDGLLSTANLRLLDAVPWDLIGELVPVILEGIAAYIRRRFAPAAAVVPEQPGAEAAPEEMPVPAYAFTAEQNAAAETDVTALLRDLTPEQYDALRQTDFHGLTQEDFGKCGQSKAEWGRAWLAALPAGWEPSLLTAGDVQAADRAADAATHPNLKADPNKGN